MTSSPSMAGGVPNGKVYVFGGCDTKSYSNANILVLSASESNQHQAISLQNCSSNKTLEDYDD